MGLIDRKKFSLNNAELTLLLQKAEPQAMVQLSNARQRTKGMDAQEVARKLERAFVFEADADQDFLEYTAAYVSAISKLFDKQLANHGNNAELLGTVLNVAKQIDRMEDATTQGANFISKQLAGAVPSLDKAIGNLLPVELRRSLNAFGKDPEKPANAASNLMNTGVERSAAVLIALATRRALKESYGIEIQPAPAAEDPDEPVH